MSKIAILAEKSSQAKAYADAFSVKSRHKTHIELNPCSTFPSGAVITWGIGHLVELKEPKEYRKEWASWNLASLPLLPSKYEYKFPTVRVSSSTLSNTCSTILPLPLF